MNGEITTVEQGDFLLQVDRKQILELKREYDMFRMLQKEVLEENVDYGWPGGRQPGQKPSLYKSGAEKLLRLFRLIPKFDILAEIEREDFIMYKVKCILKTRTGIVVGEGFGACNSREKSGWDENPWKHQNSILKIAKKRAFVDATLTGLGASNVFTQDLEDIEEEERQVLETPPQKEKKITDKTRNYIFHLIGELADLAETNKEEILEELKDEYEFERLHEIPQSLASKIIEDLQQRIQHAREMIDDADR